MKNFDADHRERDRSLRWQVLRLLDDARQAPRGMKGVSIFRNINAAGGEDHFEGATHAVSLLHDLRGLGLIELEDARTEEAEEYGLPFLYAKVTAKGSRFVMRGEPPDPLINDGRMVKPPKA